MILVRFDGRITRYGICGCLLRGCPQNLQIRHAFNLGWIKIMATESVVLVVDSDVNEREIIMRTLEEEQLRVLTAEHAQDAQRLMKEPVDLVISQLESSALDGLELLRSWKQQSPDTPFVLVTESNNVSSAVEAMKLGAADCIVKPIDTEELRMLVVKLLDSQSTNGLPGRQQRPHSNSPRRPNIDIPPGTSLEDLERAAVEQALAQHHGNRTHAAKTLGISVRTLQRKLKAWGMPMVSAHHHSAAANFLLPTPASPASNAYSAHAH
jgi:DNA-binding NtrC family response regulator